MKSTRIAATLDKLASLYQRRRRDGKPVEWLLARCKRISAAYLEACEQERNLPL